MERKRLLLIYGSVLLLALGVRLLMAYFANAPETPRTHRPDTPGYLVPARSMAADGSYVGTRRPPGLPVVAAMVFKSGGGEKSLSFLLSALAAMGVLAVCRAGFIYGGHKIGILAGVLYALHPTAIGNAPLLLSDSWAGVFAALQYWLFLEFFKNKKWWGIAGAALAAGIGTLIRPVNSLFFLPLLVLTAIVPQMNWKRKAAAAGMILLLFFLPVIPWMARNAAQGAGFCVDTNTGAMYHQNGAMLLGEVTGNGYEAEKQRILREQEQLFRDTGRFPDEASRERYRIGCYRELVGKHFGTWLKQQMNYQILLPDVPAVLESAGVTSSDRGTMAVLKERGIMAAVRHYFGEEWYWLLLPLLPLVAVAGVVYLGCAWQLGRFIRDFRKSYPELLIFGAFVVYYLFLPGAITAPRYQIPALPALTVLAALGIREMVESWKKWRSGDDACGKDCQTAALED